MSTKLERNGKHNMLIWADYLFIDDLSTHSLIVYACNVVLEKQSQYLLNWWDFIIYEVERLRYILYQIFSLFLTQGWEESHLSQVCADGK